MSLALSLLVAWIALLLSPFSSPLLPVSAQCGDILYNNDGGSNAGGIAVRDNGAIIQGWTGFSLTTRAQTTTPPYSGLGRSYASTTSPAYAPTDAAYFWDIACDWANTRCFAADHQAASPGIHVVKLHPNSQLSYRLVPGAGITIAAPRALAYDSVMNYLYVIDNTSPPRLISVNLAVPASSFAYNYGATLGWVQDGVGGVCVDAANGFIYVTSHQAKKLWRITRVNSAGAAVAATLLVNGYLFGSCVVDSLNQKLFASTVGTPATIRIVNLATNGVATVAVESGFTLDMGTGLSHQVAWDPDRARLWVAGAGSTWALQVTCGDAGLSALSVSAGALTPAFEPSIRSYTAPMASQSTITGVLRAGSGAVIKFATYEHNAGRPAVSAYTADTSNSPSALFTLKRTFAILSVYVSSPNGLSSVYYEVTIPVDNNPKLSSVVVKTGTTVLTLFPSFSPTVYSYVVSMASGTGISFTTVCQTALCFARQYKIGSGTYTALTNGGNIAMTIGNTFSLRVYAQDETTTAVYTFRTAYNIATLNSFVCSTATTMTPAFSSTAFSYTVGVPSLTGAVTSLVFTAVKTNSAATMTISRGTAVLGTLVSGTGYTVGSITIGTTYVTATVTADDGETTKSYVIYPASNIATLNSWVTANPVATWGVPFSAATLSYLVGVPRTTTSIQFTAVLTDSDATMKRCINGASCAALTSGTTSAAMSCALNTAFSIITTASDGVTTRTYTITLKGKEAQLSSVVSTPAGTLVPAFASGTYAYKLALAPTQTTLSLTPTLLHSLASIQKSLNNGALTATTSGAATSPAWTVVVSTSTVQLRVTAHDTTTVATYNFELVSNNKDISSVAFTSYVFTPTFSPSLLSYTLGVPTGTTSVTMTVNPANAFTTLERGIANAGYVSLPLNTATAQTGFGIDTTQTITIRSTCEAGATLGQRVYIFKVSSTTPTISAIVFGAGTLNATFSASVYNYQLRLPGTQLTLTFTPSKSDGGTIGYRRQVVGGSFTTVATGATTSAFSIAVGTDVLEIRGTSAYGTQTQDYKFWLISTESKASSIVFTPSGLNPVFASATTSYALGVVDGTTSVQVKVIPVSAFATLAYSINGGGSYTPFASNTLTTISGLVVGTTTVWVKVFAQHTPTSTVYSFQVKCNNAALSAMTLGGMTGGFAFSPTFASGVTSYGLLVVDGTALTVTATYAASAVSLFRYSVNNGGSWTTLTQSTASSPFTVTPLGSVTLKVQVVSAHGGTTTTYSTAIFGPASDARLSALSVDLDGSTSVALTPPFAASQLTYSVSSASLSAISVVLHATPFSGTVTSVEYAPSAGGYTAFSPFSAPSSALSETAGTGFVTVRVESDDNTVVIIYTINIVSSAADLSDLSCSGGAALVGAFSGGLLTYDVGMAPSATSLTFTATFLSAYATAEAIWQGTTYPISNGSPTTVLNVEVGTVNNIVIEVVAQNGVTTLQYVLSLVSNDATLSDLFCDVGVLVPSFDPSLLSYDLGLSPSTTSLSCTSLKTISSPVGLMEWQVDAGGFVTVTSGVAPSALPVNALTSVLSFRVVAMDLTVGTYTVSLKSNETSLTAISFLGADVFPALNPSILNGYRIGSAGNLGDVVNVRFTATWLAGSSAMHYSTDDGVGWTAASSTVQTSDIAVQLETTTLLVRVTAADGASTKIYSFFCALADADLSDVVIDAADGFVVAPWPWDPSQKIYTVTVINSDALTINPTTSASVVSSLSGSTDGANFMPLTSAADWNGVSVVPGSTTVTIRVVASYGGHSEDYLFQILQASGDARLGSLVARVNSTAATLRPAFNKDVFVYSVSSLDEELALVDLTVAPFVGVYRIEYSVDGIAWVGLNAAGDQTPQLSISVAGSGALLISVVAMDRANSKVYTVNVQSALTTLQNLTVSGGTLYPPFLPSLRDFFVSMDPLATSLSLIPLAWAPTAVVRTKALGVTYTTPSQIESFFSGLTVGSATPLVVNVTAADGSTDVYRLLLKSNIADIATIVFTNADIFPAFETTTANYSLGVEGTLGGAATISFVATTISASASALHVSLNGGSNWTPVTIGSSSAGLPVVIGTTTVSVRCTAADGNTQRVYEFTVMLDDAALTNVVFVAPFSILSPSFAANQTQYALTVIDHSPVDLTPTTRAGSAIFALTGWLVNGASIGAEETLTNTVPWSPIVVTPDVTQIVLRVTAQYGGHSQEYRIHVVQASSEARLNSIAVVENGTPRSLRPDFDSNTLAYAISSPSAAGTTPLVLTVDPKTSVWLIEWSVSGGAWTAMTTVTPALNVAPGSGDVQIRITAADHASTFVYSVNLTSSYTTLDAFAIDTGGSLTSAFVPATSTGYVISMAPPATTLSLTATTAVSLTTITAHFNGVNTSLPSGVSTGLSGLIVGDTTKPLSLFVLAQDGSVRTYVFSLLSNFARLQSLTCSVGTLIPGFTAGNLIYSLSAAPGASSIACTATQGGSTLISAISWCVDGTLCSALTSGVAPTAKTVSLTSLITIAVMAQDGVTVNTVQLQIVSNDATLSQALFSGAALFPVFSPATTSYTLGCVGSEGGLVSTMLTATTSSSAASALDYSVDGGGTWTPLTSSVQTGSFNVAIGVTSVWIRVIAEDVGATRVYIFDVQLDDADLSSLVFSAFGSILSPASFVSTGRLYNLTVINSHPISLTPTLSGAVVTSLSGSLDGTNFTPLVSGAAWLGLAVVPGVTTISIRIVAKYGGHTEIYRISVKPASTESRLLSLSATVVGAVMLPAFSSDVRWYALSTASADPLSAVLEVIPVSAVLFKLEYRVQNDTVWTALPLLGGDTSALSLPIGTGVVTIRVHAQNQVYSEYFVTAASSNLSISGLEWSLPSPDVFDPSLTLLSYQALAPFGRSPFNFSVTLPADMSGARYSLDAGATWTELALSAVDSVANPPLHRFSSAVFEIIVGTPAQSAMALRIVAQDRITYAEITLAFLCTDSSLISVTPNPGLLTPAFTRTQSIYQMLLSSATTSLKLTVVPRALSPLSLAYSVTTAGAPVWVPLLSGLESVSIPTVPGVTSFTVRVVAAAGASFNTSYFITTAIDDACDAVPSPCLNGAICSPSYAFDWAYPYKCACANGFRGVWCEQSYADIVSDRLQAIQQPGGQVNLAPQDVCVVSNPCHNGGACRSKLNVNGTRYDFVSCSCSPGFFGPFCDSVVVDCADCLFTWNVPKAVTLYGVALSSLTDFKVARRSMNGLAVQPVARSALRTPLDPQWPARVREATLLDAVAVTISAMRPSELSVEDGGSNATRSASRRLLQASNYRKGYVPLQLRITVNESGVSFPYESSSLRGLFYFSDSTCTDEGTFGSDGDGGCNECPEGCSCPGADRCWPVAGFWSMSELHIPQRCPIPDTCLGTVPSAAFAVTVAGDKNTQQCAEGYTSVTCSVCETGYYATEGRCWRCTDATAYAVVMLLIFLAIMVFVSFCVAVLSPQLLAKLVATLILLQGVVVVGKSGARGMSQSETTKRVADVFNALSIVNLDLECFRPGCTNFSPTFIQFYFATIALMIFSAGLFIVACLIRGCMLSKQRAQMDALEKKQRKRAKIAAARKAKQAQLDSDEAPDESDPAAAAKLPISAWVQPSSSSPVASEGRVVKLHFAAEADEASHDAADGPVRVPISPLPGRGRAAPVRSASGQTFRRIVHSLFICGAIFYLRLTSLSLRMLNCTNTVGAPSTVTAEGAYLYDDMESQTIRLYLVADLRQRCWEGGHTASAIFAVVFLIFFSLLYPVYALILLTRTFANSQSTGCVRVMVHLFACCRGAGFKRAKKGASSTHGKVSDDAELAVGPAGVAQVATQNQIELFAYLFRGLRPSLYYYRISLYPIQFLYAAMTTFYPGSPFTTFVLGVASALQTLYIVLYLPFLSWSFNVVSALASLATIGHAMLMLGLVGGSTIVTLMLPLAILCALLIVLLLSRKQINRVCEQCRVALQENEGADDEDDDEDEEEELEMASPPPKKAPSPALPLSPPSVAPSQVLPPLRARGSHSPRDAVVSIAKPADSVVDAMELGSPEAGSVQPASVAYESSPDPPDQHSSRIASPSHGAGAAAAVASLSPASVVSVSELVIRAPREPRT